MVSRARLVDEIATTLSVFELLINKKGLLNLHDDNIYAEDVFKGVLNIIYDLSLTNLNELKSNQPSIDLHDKNKMIAFQITSEVTQRKLKHTMDTFISKGLFNSYTTLKFLFISSNKKVVLRDHSQGQFVFSPKEDILFLNNLFKDIAKLDLDDLEKLNQVLEKELSPIRVKENTLRSFDDEKIIKNIRNTIDRPAMHTPFHRESNMNDFQDAIREIIEIMNTGFLKNQLISKSRHEIKNLKLKNKIAEMYGKICGLRDAYIAFVNNNEIEIKSYGFSYTIKDQSIKDFFNVLRKEIVVELNLLIEEYNFAIDKIKIF